jgi:hypothetical protein
MKRRSWSRKSSTCRCRPRPTTYNLEALAKKGVGTKMGGENKVGVTIEQLMTLEAKVSG